MFERTIMLRRGRSQKGGHCTFVANLAKGGGGGALQMRGRVGQKLEERLERRLIPIDPDAVYGRLLNIRVGVGEGAMNRLNGRRAPDPGERPCGIQSGLRRARVLKDLGQGANRRISLFGEPRDCTLLNGGSWVIE